MVSCGSQSSEAPSPTPHGDVDGAMAAARGGAIDLLGRLGGRDGGRTGADLDGHVERIAVGHAARGGQQDGLRRFAQLGLGEQNPAGIALIEIAQPRLAVPQVEGDTAFAGGALQAGGAMAVIGIVLID